MSSVQHLREFISERLTAAAEEIFGVFHRTIAQYEEEMDRQRRLLDAAWRPEIHLDRTELPHHFLRNDEEEIPADQQLWDQEGKTHLDPEEPDPAQVKEEHNDLCFIKDEEQPLPKLDTETSTVGSAHQQISSDEAEPNADRFRCGSSSESERRDSVGSWKEDSEPARTLKLKRRPGRNGSPAGFWSSQEKDPPVLKLEADYFVAPGHQNLLDPVSFPAAEVRDQELSSNNGYRTTELKPEERRPRKRVGSDCVVQREFNPNACPRPVSCDVCGKAFRCNSDMRVHYRVHTGEKPYSCEICQRAFSYKANLSVHMRTHTGEKPYSCRFCEKRFSDHSSLRKHVYVHTGEKPYSCAVCGKRFSRNSHLWRHVRLHAAEAPSA